MVKQKKKLQKLGGSLGIVIPYVWVSMNDLKHKDQVDVEVSKDNKVIITKED